MRLTLRTLLAFLDGILDADDQNDIGEKVKESEYATQLVHRTRDVVRRMRLEAPELTGTGVCHDPNSVAEYLDNTLAPEQIAEFERICLESDVHLAEVGSCHHVLTMILGEPANVDPTSRERMYQLGSTNPEIASAAAQPEAPSHDPTQEHARNKPEVPSYLRESQGSPLRSVLVVGLLAAAIAGVLVMLNPQWLNPPAPKTPADVADGSGLTGGSGVTPQPTDPPTPTSPTPADAVATTPPVGPPAETPSPTDPPASVGQPGAPVAAGSATGDDAVVKDGAVATIPSDVNDRAAAAVPPVAPVEPPVESAVEPPTADAPADAVADALPADAPTTDLPPATAATSDPAAPAEVPVAAPVEDTPAAPTDAPAPADTADTPSDTVAELPADVAEPVVPRAPVTLGKLLSEDQVLLRWNPSQPAEDSDAVKAAHWNRLDRQASLRLGDKLLVLPTYRPMIIVGGTTIELDDATLIELTDIDENNVPQVTVHYGRLVVLSLGNPNAQLQLVLHDREGTATLRDAESTLAVEVRPYRRPGTDPTAVPSYAAVDMYGASGEVVWEESGDVETVVPLVGPAHLTLETNPADQPSAANDIPKWIERPQLTPLEKRASPLVAQRLRREGSLKVRLSEQVDHRLPEVRNLVIRSCAHIGHYDPVIRALADEKYRSGWTTFTRELRDALDRDPARGDKIRMAFERVNAEAAPRLYRMLWGYSNPQLLEEGEAKNLVIALDDDLLMVRVVAFWNLEDITGVRYNYRPEYSETRRRQHVGRWRREEKTKSIVHPEPKAPAARAPKNPAPAAPSGSDTDDVLGEELGGE